MATRPEPILATSSEASLFVVMTPLHFDDFYRDHHGGLFAALCLTTGSRGRRPTS